jgi:Rad3-related DNA helicase
VIETKEKSKTMRARDCFPFEQAREGQLETIDQIQRAFELGKRFVLCDLPTGSGKSPIAVALARFYDNSYILTPFKSLYSQYAKDFGQHLVGIQGRANYMCTDHPSLTCGQCNQPESGEVELTEEALEKETKFVCKADRNCTYISAKRIAQNAPLCLSNFSYFLTEQAYVGDFNQRKLLIVDEAHLIEKRMMEFTKLSIRYPLLTKLNIPFVRPKSYEWKILLEWFGILLTSLHQICVKLEDEIDEMDEKGFDSTLNFRLLKKRLSITSGLIAKVDYIISKADKKWVCVPDVEDKGFVVMPLWVGDHSERLLWQWGERILLTSATILNKEEFCKLVGIPIDEAEFIQMPSTFPVRNRPIYLMKMGNLDWKALQKEETYESVAVEIDLIASRYKEQKGIIHCQSYALAKKIEEHMRGFKPSAKRVMYHESFNFAEKFNNFLQSNEPRIFCSPVILEGVDLCNELSRFQIFVKVPYGYTKDPLIERRMKENPRWYDYDCALSIIQGLGRSVRSKDDYADSYLLDSRFSHFMTHPPTCDLFPEWLRKAIVKLGG